MTGRKKVKGLAKEYTGITHRHSQQCGNGQRSEGVKGAGEDRQELGGGKQRGENGDICNSANKLMNKANKRTRQFFKVLVITNEDTWHVN